MLILYFVFLFFRQQIVCPLGATLQFACLNHPWDPNHILSVIVSWQDYFRYCYKSFCVLIFPLHARMSFMKKNGRNQTYVCLVLSYHMVLYNAKVFGVWVTSKLIPELFHRWSGPTAAFHLIFISPMSVHEIRMWIVFLWYSYLHIVPSVRSDRSYTIDFVWMQWKGWTAVQDWNWMRVRVYHFTDVLRSTLYAAVRQPVDCVK